MRDQAHSHGNTQCQGSQGDVGQDGPGRDPCWPRCHLHVELVILERRGRSEGKVRIWMPPPHSHQYLDVELKVHSPQWPIWWSCCTICVWAVPGCERPPTPLWEQGRHRLHTVRRGGSRSLVQGAGAWWSRLGPCRSLASTSRGPCGGVICFSLPYCPNFKKLTRLFRKFFFITLSKQFVSVLLFSVFFLFCVLCQLICNSLALVSDLKLTQVILELA